MPGREMYFDPQPARTPPGVAAYLNWQEKLEYIEGPEKPNGAHLFRAPMEHTAPEDIYFDFRLP